MERYYKKSTIKEIFRALTEEDSSPTEDAQILAAADSSDLIKVKTRLQQGGVLSEMEYDLGIYQSEAFTSRYKIATIGDNYE